MDPRHLLYLALLGVFLLTKCTLCTVIPGSEPDQTCNNCCQGLQGTNGITGPGGMPGSPGNNGLPGRDGIPARDGLAGRDGVGLRGDPGSKGEKGDVGFGERGPPGPEGPSGERGESGIRGLSGKVGPIGHVGPIGPVGPTGPVASSGPVGPIGPVGPVGPTGRDGERGLPGESGQQRQSAFSVQKSGNQVAAADYEIITFDEARVNVGGHFDLNTNRFVCQIPGVYFFTYSAYVTESREQNPDITLMKDGTNVATARSEPANTQVSSSTMLTLEEGNHVWLQFLDVGEGINADGGGTNKRCQFSGFLLYELM